MKTSFDSLYSGMGKTEQKNKKIFKKRLTLKWESATLDIDVSTRC